MKRIALVLVLLLCLPACAGALTAFDTSSGEFQWHLSDMCETYIDWQAISAQDEYTLLYGKTDTLPALFITEDRDGSLYEVAVVTYLPTVYNAETDALLEQFLDTASTATHTLALLERLETTQDIRLLNQNVMYTVLLDARKAQSMDFLLDEPVMFTQHVLAYRYSHELYYDTEADMIYYSLLITHD